MTIAWIVGGVVFAVLMAWLSEKGKEPVPQEPLYQAKINAILDALLYRGIERTKLEIWVRDDPRVWVLSKYHPRPATATGPVGIRGELPREAWSEPFYETFRTELTSKGIPFTEVRALRERPAALIVDFGTDLRLACVVTQLLFERVFRVSLEKECVGHFNEHLLPMEVPRFTGIARTGNVK